MSNQASDYLFLDECTCAAVPRGGPVGRGLLPLAHSARASARPSHSPAMRVVCSVDEHQPADSAQRFLRGLLHEHGGGPGRSQRDYRSHAGLGGVPVSLQTGVP
jgi:hypothetical protein